MKARDMFVVGCVVFAAAFMLLAGCKKEEEEAVLPPIDKVVETQQEKAAEQEKAVEQQKEVRALTPEQKAEIQRLVGVLESDAGRREKEAAAEKLGAFGPAGRDAIPALIKMLGTEEEALLNFAAEKALAAIGDEAVRALIKEDVVGGVGFHALRVFKRIGESAAKVLVDELKKTGDDDIRKTFRIPFALGEMGGAAACVLPELEAMKEKGGKNVTLETAIDKIKRGKGKKEEDKYGAFMEASRKTLDKLEDEKAELERRMGKTSKDSHKLADEVIAPKLNIESPLVNVLLKRVGDDTNKALPILKKLLESNDATVRMTSLACLMKFGEKSEADKAKVLPLVQKCLDDEEPGMHALAAAILVRFGNTEEAEPVLVSRLKESQNVEEQTLVLGALVEGKIPVKDEKALAVMQTILVTDKPDMLRAMACLALVNAGEATESVLRTAVDMLKSEDEESREYGAAVLWKLGPKAKSAAAELRAAERKEEDPDLRQLISIAITSLGKAEEDVDTLVAQLNSTDRIIRVNASLKLKGMNSASKKKAVPSLLKMINEAKEEKKDFLVFVLCRLGKDAEEAYPTLVALLKESLNTKNEDNQFLLTDALSEIGNEKTAPLFVEVLRTGEEGAANSANIGLRKLGPKAKAVVPELIEMMKDPKHYEDVELILPALGTLEKEEYVISIAEFLENEDRASDVAFLLGGIGGEKAIPVLKKKLDSQEYFTRLWTITALELIADKNAKLAPAVAETLREALKKEKDERLVKNIKEFLEKKAGTKQ